MSVEMSTTYGALILDYVCTKSDCLPTKISKKKILVNKVAQQVLLTQSERDALNCFLSPSVLQALKERNWKLSSDENDPTQLRALHQNLDEELANINDASYKYPFDLEELNKEISQFKDPLFKNLLTTITIAEAQNRVAIISDLKKDSLDRGHSLLKTATAGKSTLNIKKFIRFIEHQVPRKLYLQGRIKSLLQASEGERKEVAAERAPTPETPNPPREKELEQVEGPLPHPSKFENCRITSPLEAPEGESKEVAAGRAPTPEDPKPQREDLERVQGLPLPTPSRLENLRHGNRSDSHILPHSPRKLEALRKFTADSKRYWIVQKIQNIFAYILDRIAAFWGRIGKAWIDRNRISPSGSV